MEEHNDAQAEDGSIRSWFQENLRVVTSVFIVAVIAFGIYSYSDRSLSNDEDGIDGQTASSDTEKIVEEEAIGEETVESTTTVAEATAEEEEAEETMIETSRETTDSFMETAKVGDGLTHLARRAAGNYLEKNADSSITAEHRIYIEDYLRKKVGHEGGVRVGTSVEFSKDLIGEAVAASKQLDERQLENLKRYSARVSEFQS